MIYIDIDVVLDIHARAIADAGGSAGIRDRGALESAVAQPRMTFGGQELYADLVEKAAALGFSLIKNHPFADGNKRAGHAAMETFLVLNDCQIVASVDEQEKIILDVAAGKMDREPFTEWLRQHVAPV